MTAPTYASILYDAAETLLEVLQDAAKTLNWEPTVGVATVEPGFDCDAIVVWVEQIRPEFQNHCLATLNVTFRYALSMCIGADQQGTAEFYSEDALQRLWVAVVTASETSASLLGDKATDVGMGPLTILQSPGDVPVWSGTVTAILSAR